MKLRESNIQKLKDRTYEVLIIGGGINGAVAAAALAGKGVKTALIDQGDFAGMTSQESSNLVWGGVKYLETMEFLLVRRLCKSRNTLIRNYPSTVKEIRFLTTVAKGFRYHPILVWLGTWLYWFIGNGFTQTPRLLSIKNIQSEEEVINTENATGGFEYSDAYLYDNDARFVFGFIRSALTNGCIAANYIESVASRKNADGLWETRVRNGINGESFIIKSKVLINATGPLADQYNHLVGQVTHHHLVFSKGIHLIVNQITQSHKILTFFASDGRLFFVIPMGSKTCIGTTDTLVEKPTKEITDEDRDFVLSNINQLLKLKQPISKKDIISERCGVRPLVIEKTSESTNNWMKLSRKHAIDLNAKDAFMTIFGGKLTDCLNVGDEVCVAVKNMGVEIPLPDHKWYGEPDAKAYKEFMYRAKLIELDQYTSAESSENLSSRLWRRYGETAFSMLEQIQENPEQADVLIKGTEYIKCELKEAAQREMITKLEDFLRRRTKIALVEREETIKTSKGLLEACNILFGEEAQKKLEEYFSKK